MHHICENALLYDHLITNVYLIHISQTVYSVKSRRHGTYRSDQENRQI